MGMKASAYFFMNYLLFFDMLVVMSFLVCYLVLGNYVWSLMLLCVVFVYMCLYCIALGFDFLGLLFIFMYSGGIVMLLLFMMFLLNEDNFNNKLKLNFGYSSCVFFSVLFLLVFRFAELLRFKLCLNQKFTDSYSVSNLMMNCSENSYNLTVFIYMMEGVTFFLVGLLLFMGLLALLLFFKK